MIQKCPWNKLSRSGAQTTGSEAKNSLISSRNPTKEQHGWNGMGEIRGHVVRGAEVVSKCARGFLDIR